MKIFPRLQKNNRESGHYFFGDHGELDVGFSSLEIFDEDSNIQLNTERPHYHKTGTEFYISLEGNGVLEVDGREILLAEHTMVQVDPGEIHRLRKAESLPFRCLIVCTVKDLQDKVVIE